MVSAPQGLDVRHCQTVITQQPEATRHCLEGFAPWQPLTRPVTGHHYEEIVARRRYPAAILCFSSATQLAAAASVPTSHARDRSGRRSFPPPPRSAPQLKAPPRATGSPPPHPHCLASQPPGLRGQRLELSKAFPPGLLGKAPQDIPEPSEILQRLGGRFLYDSTSRSGVGRLLSDADLRNINCLSGLTRSFCFAQTAVASACPPLAPAALCLAYR